jgi:hypothetical protein
MVKPPQAVANNEASHHATQLRKLPCVIITIICCVLGNSSHFLRFFLEILEFTGVGKLLLL